MVAFAVLQFIPLPRTPLEYSPEIHESTEPWAIGLGFPFATVKLYLGDGCLSGKVPCKKGGFSYGYRFFHHGSLISQIGTGFELRPGDIVPTNGGMIRGVILWLPLFLIAYILALKKLQGIGSVQKSKPLVEIFGFLTLLLVAAFSIAPLHVIYVFSPAKWGQQCFTRYVPTYTPSGFIVKETDVQKETPFNCAMSGYITFNGYKDQGRKITLADSAGWMIEEDRNDKAVGRSPVYQERIKKQNKQLTVLSDRQYTILNEVHVASTDAGLVETISQEEMLVGFIGNTIITITNYTSDKATKISPEEMVKIFTGLRKE
ncbi:hypothetical protein HY385_02940 [Candidatus Daviesbacteria bacterium]|nr:hypothetical protein [Candidatus Daviesbacteria bacterium]